MITAIERFTAVPGQEPAPLEFARVMKYKAGSCHYANWIVMRPGKTMTESEYDDLLTEAAIKRRGMGIQPEAMTA